MIHYYKTIKNIPYEKFVKQKEISARIALFLKENLSCGLSSVFY
jgi:hypothetical protein